jgi:DNA mismatch repair protein MutL
MEDYLIYREISSYLTRLGFIFSELSGRTVVLEAIPTELKSGNETDMVLKIIHTLKEEKIPSDMMFDRFAMAFSKNNAVRKGDVLSYEEMLSLVDTLFACEQPNITPDGKPVFVNISIEELEQKFK